MAKEFSKAFYKSTAWLNCRESYISFRRGIDGGMCERCHKQLGYIVHHKVYLDAMNINDPLVALNHNNLEYVCKECHDAEHFTPEEKPTLCRFDSQGRPING